MVRRATASDVDAILAIYAPFCESTHVSFEEVAPAPEEMRRRVLETPYPWLVFESDGVVVGYAYASRHRERAAYRWSVEVSAYVAEGQRGRGVGRALYAELLTLLAELGYYKAFAGIGLPNDASVALHESVGFTLVGVFRGIGYKHGKWHDVAWYQRSLRAEDTPGEPTPVEI
jgi:phosphinothricin acetyltransferase